MINIVCQSYVSHVIESIVFWPSGSKTPHCQDTKPCKTCCQTAIWLPDTGWLGLVTYQDVKHIAKLQSGSLRLVGCKTCCHCTGCLRLVGWLVTYQDVKPVAAIACMHRVHLCSSIITLLRCTAVHLCIVQIWLPAAETALASGSQIHFTVTEF